MLICLSLQGSCSKLDIYPHREGLWLILRDLSSRQAIEQQLRERDEILTMAEQSAGIGVWDINLATQTVRGTPQFWRVMGLPPTEEALPIETTRRLRLPEDGERVAKGFRAILDNHAESLRWNTGFGGRTAKSGGFSDAAGWSGTWRASRLDTVGSTSM